MIGQEDENYDKKAGSHVFEKEAGEYDPETGERLTGENHTEDGSSAPPLYDPETGERLTDENQFGDGASVPDLYDPETGERLTDKNQMEDGSPAPDLYDPETGEPLAASKRSEEDAPAPDLFDPMTGRPLYQGSQAAPENLFDPETGKKIGSKSRKPFLIGAAAIVILLAVVFTAMGSVKRIFKSKKDVVADALIELVKADGYLEETFNLSGFRETIKKDSVKLGGELKLEDVSGLGLTGMEGAGGRLDFSRDTGNHKALLSMGAMYEDMELLNLDLYIDNKQWMCAMPSLIDPVFTLNYADDLGQQIEDSPMLDDMFEDAGEGAEVIGELIEDTSGMITGENTYFDIASIIDRYKKTTKATEELKDSLEIEKKESKKFTVNGKTQKCKGYDVVIPKKAMVEFVKTTGKFLADDEQLKEQEIAYLNEILEALYLAGGHSREDAEKFADQATDEWSDNIEFTADWLEDFIKDYMEDIELTLYVDKKGHAVYLDMETSIEAYTQIDIKAEMTFKGGDSPLQNMDGTIRLSGGGDTVKVSIEKTGSEKEHTYISELITKISTGYDTLQTTMEGEYNRKNGEFTVNVKQKTGAYEYKVSAEGAVSELKKGKSVVVDIDKLRFRVQDTTALELSGKFFIKPLSGKIEPLEGETFDVLAASQGEWREVAEDFMREIGRMSRMINGF